MHATDISEATPQMNTIKTQHDAYWVDVKI